MTVHRLDGRRSQVPPVPAPTFGSLSVTTHGIVRRFGAVTALNGAEMQVPSGSVYVLVGPNGAGKTTLMKVLMGICRPDAGRCEVLGLDPQRDGPQVRASVGYMPDRTNWDDGWMRVGRLLRHREVFYPTWDAGYAGHLMRTLAIDPGRRIRDLSKGEARRVQVVLALAHRPPLLLLDEPTDGLDPLLRDRFMTLFARQLADTETTTVISTHRPDEVDRLADHLGVLDHGRFVTQAPVDEVRRCLRVYRADVPVPWQEPAGLPGVVLERSCTRRQIAWTVWGDEGDVTSALAYAGATVREVSALSLDDAVVTVIRAGSQP